MTREEVIEEVKNYDSYPNGLSKECRDYIINALEQEPIEVEAAKLQGAYNKGYADGQRTLAEHIELCKEEQEPTTKNDLGVDAVSRKAVINQIFYSTDNNGDVVLGLALRERIARLPSVTPQEPKTEQKKNCNNCKYGYLSSVCKKPTNEICGNNFSQWKPYKALEQEPKK